MNVWQTVVNVAAALTIGFTVGVLGPLVAYALVVQCLDEWKERRA